MNLLDKNKLGLILLLILFLFSCEDPNEIGLELKGDSEKVGAFYKEISLSTTLINNDSLLTSSIARLLTGRTYDDNFGTLSASSFTQYGYNSILDIPADATYDSLILYVYTDYVTGSGITSPQRFSVHELTEDLYDTAAYFSFDSASFDPIPIAISDFQFTEDDDTVVTFDIADSYGMRLLEAVKDTNLVDPTDVETLQELFKGFAFVSDEANNTVMGIYVLDGQTILNLYYTSAEEDTSTYYSFGFFTGAANFNHFLTDRMGTPLQGIEDLHYEEFTPTNGNAYIQSGANLVTKIDFTPLLDFFDTIEYSTINQTTIDININEPGENVKLPSYVSFYYTNESNKRIRAETEYIGILVDGSTELQRAFYNGENHYEATISAFTDNLVQGNNTNYEVLLYPPDFGLTNSVNQFTADPSKIILKIYYSKVK